MGIFDKLREKSRGVLSAAKPEPGVAPASEDDVRARLRGITGKGITTTADGDALVVAWSAKVDSAGIDGAEHQYLYRAIRLEADEAKHEVKGICLKTTTNAELDFNSFSFSKAWERGQHIGAEKLHVIAWLGPHRTEGGADEKGYTFSWGLLRDPVIDAITGAGWTYKPQKV